MQEGGGYSISMTVDCPGRLTSHAICITYTSVLMINYDILACSARTQTCVKLTETCEEVASEGKARRFCRCQSWKIWREVSLKDRTGLGILSPLDALGSWKRTVYTVTDSIFKNKKALSFFYEERPSLPWGDDVVPGLCLWDFIIVWKMLHHQYFCHSLQRQMPYFVNESQLKSNCNISSNEFNLLIFLKIKLIMNHEINFSSKGRKSIVKGAMDLILRRCSSEEQEGVTSRRQLLR